MKDSWTIGRRLTLNLGAAVHARQRRTCQRTAARPQLLPPTSSSPPSASTGWSFAVFNSVAPRLHAAYDIAGDGKTVIKGGWGRYDHMRQIEPDAWRLAAEQPGLWHLSLARPEREQRLRSPGRSTAIRTGAISSKPRAPSSRKRSPKGVVNPNEKQSKQDEFSLSLERELIANFAVRVTGVYTRTLNINRVQNNLRPYEAYNIPVTNRDPGLDGEVGTADDGGLITYYEFRRVVAGRQIRGVHGHQRPERRSALQERGSGGGQTARESLAVHGLLLGHEERQTPASRPESRREPERRHGHRGRLPTTPTKRSTGPIGPGTGMPSCSGAYIFPGDVMVSRELPPSQRRRVRPDR